MTDTTFSANTIALNAGLSRNHPFRVLAPDITMSINHHFQPDQGAFSAEQIDDLTQTDYLYASWMNPTVRQLERRLAALEQTEDSFACASGMAAITATFLGLLKAGDHLLINDVCYAGVSELALKLLPEWGIEVSCANLTNMEEVTRAIRPNTRLIHAESPCNPLLRLTDIQRLTHWAHQQDILVSVDSTFATPLLCQPATLGADLVIHSLTKFMNGHGDAMGGCVNGHRSLIQTIRSRAGAYFGATLSAQNAWLIMRGIDTLPLRMQQACATAAQVARWLEQHPKVKRVIYPGLASHPQKALAQKIFPKGGAMLTFQVDDLDAVADAFAHKAKVFYYAFSLGHQRSLAVALKTQPLLQNSYSLNQEQLADYARYAGDGVIRLAIGLESATDLIADLTTILGAS
ncbi:trans-sulfuration enzyme family protein [Celerinatantimonas sp. YJH-8]|uniref:trans-sulfuration enzyme family protein n=1 Tax=Celerinatantimonas sp. YJH-8 TaxID=3228714 RepID=UPI0038BEC762